MKQRTKWILFTGILIGFGSFIHAQPLDVLDQRFKSKTHTYRKTTLPYRLYLPENYDETKSYPLLLCLHGAGERGADNSIHIKKHELATSWAKSEVQEKHHAFIVAPQCPKKMKWSYTDWSKG